MKNKKGVRGRKGLTRRGNVLYYQNEGGKTMTPRAKVDYQKDGKKYFGVKSVIRRGRQVVEGRVLVDLEGFSGRTYRFAISVDQLKQLLLGGKNGKTK